MPETNIHNNKISRFISLIKQSLRGEEHDYTQGNIRTAIILLAIPMILELSLESVFAVVDIFFVGHLPNSSSAIQTVGLTESVITIVYSIAIGLSTAATAMVARRTGEKNKDAAAHAGMQSLIMALMISAVISIVGIIFAPNILQLMGAQQDVVNEGAVFTRIMMGGSVIIILLFLINGIFRGAGDAAMAMRSLWLASLMNIILCPLFIYGAGSWNGFGLKGAAIATTIGRGIGVLYQCWNLFNGKSSVSLKKEHFKIDFSVMKPLVKIAWPATFQFLIASGSWIVLARLVAETGGTTASAGYQIAIRNVVFFILPAWGLSNAAATLVGQNLGANQPDRAAKSVLLTARYNAVFMAAVMLLFVFFSSPIISIFTKDDAVQRVGAQALMIIGAGYIFYGIGMVMMQALNGAGDTKTPTWISFVSFWVFQVPLAYLLVQKFHSGIEGIFICIPAAETMNAIAAWIFFKKGKWKKVKI
ncbi:MAG TPA: MATE family efflux transporter [Chitinophagaceae bacterium]|jgi:putative MATE family efflux protein|nr:MATE family efflux transporter [Chitinophagaceae bacterium]